MMPNGARLAGRILLEQCLLRGMQRLPVGLSATTQAFAQSLFSQISRFVKAQARPFRSSMSLWVQAADLQSQAS